MAMKHTGKKQHPIPPEHRADGTKVHLSADGKNAVPGYRGHVEGDKIRAKQAADMAKADAAKAKETAKPAASPKSAPKSSAAKKPAAK